MNEHKQKLIGNLKTNLNQLPASPEAEENHLELGMVWLRLIVQQVPFYKAAKILEQEDFWFDYLFFQPPLKHLKPCVNGALFYNALRFFTYVFNRIFPVTDTTVKSKVHFNEQGTADDLTSIYKVMVKAFREFVLINYLVKQSTILKELYPDFMFSMSALVENNFVKKPSEDLDVIISTEVFTRLVCIFRKKLPLLFYHQMVYSHLYQKISRKILKELSNIEIDFSSFSDSYNKTYKIEQIALSILHEIDETALRSDVKGYSLQKGFGSNTNILGRKLMNNRFFAFLEDSDEEVVEYYQSEANNIQFMVQILKPRHLPNRFDVLKKELANETRSVSNAIFKLKTQKEQQRKFINYSGILNAQRIYRKNLEDTRFFRVNERADRWSNCFNVGMLIDNSCSIPSKVPSLQKLIVLLVLVIKEHPDIFQTIHAYAQKGTAKTVSLTPLIEGNTRQIKNFGGLLYFNCKTVNYDPFALNEMLQRNSSVFCSKSDNAIPLIFVIGDAWPVSMEKDSKREGTEIMKKLRELYPRMVIINIASNPCFNPNELGYDYYITVKSINDSFSIASFKKDFEQVILKVVNDHVFC